MNDIGEHHYDETANLGSLIVNGHRCPLYKTDGTRWDARTCRYNRVFAVRVANEFNVSSPFEVRGRSLAELRRKIARHPYRLARP